jgi:hypothetical protein
MIRGLEQSIPELCRTRFGAMLATCWATRHMSAGAKVEHEAVRLHWPIQAGHHGPCLDVCADLREPAWLRIDRAGRRPVCRRFRCQPNRHRSHHRGLWPGPVHGQLARRSLRRSGRPPLNPGARRLDHRCRHRLVRGRPHLRHLPGRQVHCRGRGRLCDDRWPDRPGGYRLSAQPRSRHGDLPGRIPVQRWGRSVSGRLAGRSVWAGKPLLGKRGPRGGRHHPRLVLRSGDEGIAR